MPSWFIIDANIFPDAVRYQVSDLYTLRTYKGIPIVPSTALLARLNQDQSVEAGSSHEDV